MNYRHAYHAGNFADVVKHAVLALIIEHLKLKSGPFRIIDTHAGIGTYDLHSEEAKKTGEWHDGIGRLLNADIPSSIADLLAPYLSVVRDENPDPANPVSYPGSPLIARRLMRRGDTLILNELHPEDHGVLKSRFARDPQTKVLCLDGWVALKSLLPPKERRGAVLVDPPFEKSDELDRLATGISSAHRRFATGTFLLWYPVKSTAAIAPFHRSLKASGIPKMLIAEVYPREPLDADLLNGCGLIIINPPFTLHDNLKKLLPFLALTLALSANPSHRLEWLAA